MGSCILALTKDIEYRMTKVGRPQSNATRELRMKDRTTWYETVEEMQADLEAYLETYNRRATAPRSRHGEPHALSGLQGQPHGRQEGRTGREGGRQQEGSLDVARARAECQVITILAGLVLPMLDSFLPRD